MSKETLRIEALVDNLGEIRHFVRETAIAMGASADTVASLVLASDEVATNAIVHGYRGDAGTIELEIERQGENLVVRVRDQAPTFDLSSVPAPDLSLPLELRPIGGLGIFLAREVVDQVSHRAGPTGGNEVTLVKRLESDCK